MTETATGGAEMQRAERRHRRALLGPSAALTLVGEVGAVERSQYLEALATAVQSGLVAHREAVDELHTLTEPWMRVEVQVRVRRLPPHADPQTTEHWLWMEWHRALEQFDPERTETFPAYVALRLRMALVAAAREDDPMPRRARTRLKELERTENDLVQELGRSLTLAERELLAREVMGDVPASGWIVTDLDETATVAATGANASDPADQVERQTLVLAVREALEQAPPDQRRELLSWLEKADDHDRPPPRRLLRVSFRVRQALAPWAESRRR